MSTLRLGNNWSCSCGTSTDNGGFDPCKNTTDGWVVCEPTRHEWSGLHWACNGCGSVFYVNDPYRFDKPTESLATATRRRRGGIVWVDRDSGTYFTSEPIALDTWQWVGEDWSIWDNWSDQERVTYAEYYGHSPSLDLPSAWASKRDAQ